MAKYKLSVIIPAYITSNKGAEDLALLADKLADQVDFTKHEIIVIDDGSPIKLDFVKAAGLKYHRFEENQGTAAAKNYGIDNTSGAYIAFIDADDDVPDNYIETLESRINHELSMPFPADIVQFQARHEDGNVAYPEPCVWGKLVRRYWIGKDRFDPDQLIGEEDTLFLKKSRLIKHDSRIVYYHRQSANPDSLMKRFWRGEVPRRKIHND